MNNTKTRTLARVTVLIAATLVVGMTFAATATTTQSAFAYQMKGAGQDDGSNNGNTLTPQTGTIRDSEWI
jgi:Spy/CpxP family protein refolding chaperone